MDCQAAREQLLDRERGKLDDAARAALEAHLADCAACREAAAADAALGELLERRLPRHAAPPALKRALAQKVAAATRAPAVTAARARRWRTALMPVASALAAAALVFAVMRPRAPASGDLVREAVNDHLRVVQSGHPVEIESGGVHQVKPWFTGRLDFAPRVAFGGDDEFPLVGGNVGYFHDRKAAVFVFKRRLHTISLLVFPAEGLAWPEGDGRVRESRGFNVVLWRDGDLGYALVSDVNSDELVQLMHRLH
jgi:anti-sigma factor RsiW